jgi:hypothetical protein
LWTACLAVILAAGCQYAGAGAPFQESYDFSAAASKDWVVTITNHRAHAQHTANPTYYGTATVTDDGAQQYLDLDVAPLCGTRPFDGMVVVHSESTARFFYAGWAGEIVCISSALDTNPFAIDRENPFNGHGPKATPSPRSLASALPTGARW